METLWQDVVFGLRMLRKNPGFTAIAVIALALGLGANATVFTIANAFLFQNLPFVDSDRVLYVSSINNSTGRGRGVSYPDYRDFAAGAKPFEALGGLVRLDADVSDKTGVPMQYASARVTFNTFSIIGQKPVAGRGFLSEDAAPGAAPVAMLSFRMWESRCAKDPAAIGSTIRINEIPTVVVGVMPPGMHFPRATDLWLPLVPTGDWEKREYRRLTMFGRLAKNAGVGAARAEITTLAANLESQYPATNKDIGADVRTYNDYFTGTDTRAIFLSLLGAVGFVLLIACANVANLLLARATSRAREISVRTALGAGRWRVIRQLLVESVMLAAIGGGLGLLLGVWGVQIYKTTLIPENTPPHITFAMDNRVLAYLAAITIGTGILFGMAPALRFSRLDINSVLKDGGRGSGASYRTRHLATLLVVTEMALAFVLLVGAGLMIRSYLKMARTPIGVRTDHLMSMEIMLRPKQYPTAAAQMSFHEQLKARLDALPGVQVAAMASSLPGDGWSDFNYELDGGPPVEPRKQPRIGGIIVSPSYFPAMEIRPRRGRVLLEMDSAGGVPVALVNETLARIAWPGEEPVGRRLRLTRSSGAVAEPQPWLTVVGVIPDIVQNDEGQGAHDPLVYLPYSQSQVRDMIVFARTLVPPETLSNVFRRAVQSVDEDLPVVDLRTLDRLLWERTRSWRVYGGMFSIFAAMALLMASVGIYAVIAYSVNQRTQEIGIRRAMGASTWCILGMVFTQGMRPLLAGLAVGIAVSFGVTRFLSAFLVGVEPGDPLTLVTVGVVLILSGALGSAIPARRAIQVDPIEALRYE